MVSQKKRGKIHAHTHTRTRAHARTHMCMLCLKLSFLNIFVVNQKTVILHFIMFFTNDRLLDDLPYSDLMNTLYTRIHSIFLLMEDKYGNI